MRSTWAAVPARPTVRSRSSVSGVATRVRARTLAYESSPRDNAWANRGNVSWACATRTRSRAAPISSPTRQLNHAAHERKPVFQPARESNARMRSSRCAVAASRCVDSSAISSPSCSSESISMASLPSIRATLYPSFESLWPARRLAIADQARFLRLPHSRWRLHVSKKRWRGINWPFDPIMSAHAGNCQAEITAIRTRTTNDYSYGQVSGFRHWAREPTPRVLRPHTPGDRVAQQHRECVALPGAPEGERRRVRRIGRARPPDRRVMAVAESEVDDAALADRACVAEHARLPVGLQRGVRRIQGADPGRGRGRTVVRGQEDARRIRVLELDEIRLVLDDERWAEPAHQARVAPDHVDADLADCPMGQEEAYDEDVLLGLHGSARELSVPSPLYTACVC